MIPSMISVLKNLNWCLAPIAQNPCFSCCPTSASYLMTRVGLAPGNSVQRTNTQENVIVFTTQAWVGQILDLHFFCLFCLRLFLCKSEGEGKGIIHLATGKCFEIFEWIMLHGQHLTSVWTARQNATHLARPFEIFQLNKCSQVSIHGWEQWPTDGWALHLEGLFHGHFHCLDPPAT